MYSFNPLPRHAHTHHPTLMYCSIRQACTYKHLMSFRCPGNSFLTQDSDASPTSNGNSTPPTIGQDLDSLLGSAPSAPASAAASGAAPAQKNSDLEDLNLDDLLGPGANSAPPQRYSGGGMSGAASPIPAARGPPAATGQGWDSPPPMSYSGEFGATSGKYGDSAAGAASKALKGDQEVTLVEVGEDGACPVEEKDVDPKTVAALKARGIENFTPVQVCMIHVVDTFGLRLLSRSRSYTSI